MTTALALVGDWNATPHDRGRYSPQWIARLCGLQLHSAGPGRHGDIDYVLTDSRVTGVQRHAPPQGVSRSDHDLVRFVLHQPDGPGQLELVTWNVEFGRELVAVRNQLREVLSTYRPDLLALQEAADYHAELRAVAKALGYRWLMYPHPAAHNVLLVREELATHRPLRVQLSPMGWPLSDGTGAHAPLFATSWAVEWLRVAVVHMPPNINWRRGVAWGPVRKLAAYSAGSSKLVRWSSRVIKRRQP